MKHGFCSPYHTARVYVYWQEVILNIKGLDKGQSITEKFKKEMPEIFPDFNWDNFIEKYNSLRLSNKNK